MKKIIGFGNCLVDILVQLQDKRLLTELGLPEGSMQLIDRGEKENIDLRLQYEKTSKVPGGSAANTIKALAHQGVEVGFIGKIGDDQYGQFFADELKGLGVNTQLVVSPNKATGVATTFISPDGQRTFATFLGASSTLSVEDIKPEMLDGYDILYVEGYLVQNYALMDHVMKIAKEKKMTICLDLASYNVVEQARDFFEYLLDTFVDIVFANEEESFAITGREPAPALNMLAEKCKVAVVKLGAKGSSAKSGDEVARVAAVPVEKVVDTTGAGDFFAAGFLSTYIQGGSLTESLAKGGELSAKVIQMVGVSV